MRSILIPRPILSVVKPNINDGTGLRWRIIDRDHRASLTPPTDARRQIWFEPDSVTNLEVVRCHLSAPWVFL
jgi:hypothetical protein